VTAGIPAGLVRQSEVARDFRVECGVVIVGSGAGGATMAAELADAGVTYLSAGVPGATLAEVLDNIAWFGAEVMPAVAAVPAAPHQFG